MWTYSEQAPIAPARDPMLNQFSAKNFVDDTLAAGRPLRVLTLIDSGTRECLTLVAAPRLTDADVVRVVGVLGPSEACRRGSPWTTAYEAFTGSFRHECRRNTALLSSPKPSGFSRGGGRTTRT